MSMANKIEAWKPIHRELNERHKAEKAQARRSGLQYAMETAAERWASGACDRIIRERGLSPYSLWYTRLPWWRKMLHRIARLFGRGRR